MAQAAFSPVAAIDSRVLPEPVSSFQGKIIELDCGGGSWYHLDGEDFYSHDGKLKFTALPSVLNVIAPKQSLQER